MEAFESFVAVALEAEGLVVSSAMKFPVRLQALCHRHDPRRVAQLTQDDWH